MIRAVQRIALKLRATRAPAQGRWTKSVPRQGHNTPLPLKRSPPGSFKRLLGCAQMDSDRPRQSVDVSELVRPTVAKGYQVGIRRQLTRHEVPTAHITVTGDVDETVRF